MSLKYPDGPKELRTALHASYERYAQGIDMFPRIRLAVPADAVSRKTQNIAKLLERAWNRIDEDEAYFRGATTLIVDKALEKVAEGKFGGSMVAITQVGRHCVKMATVTPKPGGPEASLGVFPRGEFIETFDGHEFSFTDGRKLMLSDGMMRGDFDMSVVRGSNVSGIMVAQPPQPTIEDVPVGANL